jgi:hypothetical protein
MTSHQPIPELHGGGYMVHKPTLPERMWRALGFRYHLGAEPDSDQMQGWMCTESRLEFGIADRLRLLMTGRLHLRLTQHLPVKCDFSRNRFDWQIKHPGER